MTICIWRPRASRRIQRSIYDINNSTTAIRATVNGYIITGNTGANRDESVDYFVTKWNAETSPYFSKITAAPDLATATQAILTADVSGVPFVVVIEEYYSAAWHTVAAAASSVAATGPEFYDNILNWSSGAVPIAADDIWFEPCNISCCWNLPAAGPAIDEIKIWAGYTGVIGLNPNAFATSADGRTVDSTAREYRQTNWTGDIDDLLEIGIGEGAGSQRIRIEQLSASSDLTAAYIYKTAATAQDAGGYAVWFKGGTAANTVLQINDCLGGVYLDTALLLDLIVNSSSDSSYVYCGNGTDFDTYSCWGGTVYIEDGLGGVKTLGIYGGKTTIADAMAAAVEITMTGGELKLDKSSAIAALTITGGTLDLSALIAACTITALTFGVPENNYKIINQAAGIFVATGTTISGDVDWFFEAAS